MRLVGGRYQTVLSQEYLHDKETKMNQQKTTQERFEQDMIDFYQATNNVSETARVFDTSRRTVGRILEQHGIARPLQKLRGEAYHIQDLLSKYNLSVMDVRRIIESQQKQ